MGQFSLLSGPYEPESSQSRLRVIAVARFWYVLEQSPGSWGFQCKMPTADTCQALQAIVEILRRSVAAPSRTARGCLDTVAWYSWSQSIETLTRPCHTECDWAGSPSAEVLIQIAEEFPGRGLKATQLTPSEVDACHTSSLEIVMKSVASKYLDHPEVLS